MFCWCFSSWIKANLEGSSSFTSFQDTPEIAILASLQSEPKKKKREN